MRLQGGERELRPPSDVVVSLEGVRKAYGSTAVLNGVSLNVSRGEVICIIGPSGSGESTLLRCINALTPVDAGRIAVCGMEVT